MTPAEVPTLEVEDRDLSFVRIDHQVRLQLGGEGRGLSTWT